MSDSQQTKENSKVPVNRMLVHRIYQIIGFLVGAKFFTTLLLTFALYVSTFFLFNQVESLKSFVFDYKVHGIIFCTVLTVLAGGIINQFYDREKDFLLKPFRVKLQNFLSQKYFLYSYIIINLFSLTIAFFISPRVFLFFLFYQFFMWFYSHKLSKLLIINNITFVFLVVYPFFGMLVYYQTISMEIVILAVYLFLLLLNIDIIKDVLSKNVDLVFAYKTIPNSFSTKFTNQIIFLLLGINAIIAFYIGRQYNILSSTILDFYFYFSILLLLLVGAMIFRQKKNFYYLALNILRLWLFIGVIFMLLDGIISRL